MEQQVKSDWIINNQNIFGLQQDINLSISSIQYEILNQVKGKNINSISDYLGAEIDVSKEIRLTKKLTIEKVFAEFLGFENINLLDQNTFNCSLILGYLQLSLFKEYRENKHKNILTFSEYKTQYNSLLNNFLASNIDTDEQDFIKAELTLCNNLLTEMNKPVYSVLSPLNEVLDKPCEYKKNLTNSIDKRRKFLEKKANNQTQSEVLPPQQTEKPKPELSEALISFSSTEIIDSLHSELKGYFQGKEAELKKALQGEQLKEFLLFPHNQNKFVEVFKRLKYNGFLLSTPKEINNWICSNFTYIRTKGDKKEVKNFNESTIKTLLTNSVKERQAEPTPKERICTPDWLPHFWSNELKNKQN